MRLVEVTEDTMDPKVWGQNWPTSTTAISDSLPTVRSTAGAVSAPATADRAEQKLDRSRGSSASSPATPSRIDYRDRRGHAYMLFDQEQTARA